MYIEIHDYECLEQKVLYFKLNNAFNLNTISDINCKFAGIYAIFKDNLCLYIGQSKNFASRIATHLTGKYKNSTEIFFWNVEEIGFNDFHTRNEYSKQSILDNCEQWFMAELKPIENINIDMSFKLSKDLQPIVCFDEESSLTINVSKDVLKICNPEYYNLESLSASIYSLLFSNQIDEKNAKLFFDILSVEKMIHIHNKRLNNE